MELGLSLDAQIFDSDRSPVVQEHFNCTADFDKPGASFLGSFYFSNSHHTRALFSVDASRNLINYDIEDCEGWWSPGCHGSLTSGSSK